MNAAPAFLSPLLRAVALSPQERANLDRIGLTSLQSVDRNRPDGFRPSGRPRNQVMLAAAREYLSQQKQGFGDLREFADAKGLRYDCLWRAIGYIRDDGSSKKVSS